MTQVLPRAAGRLQVRARIVEAAARLLHDHGPAAVTTRAVAEAASTQAPTIYRLFGDKDGLLDAVAEHELARYVTAKAPGADSGDPVADLRAAWDDHVRFGLANPALVSYLADPDRGARSPAAAAGLDVLRARVSRLAATGRLRVPEERAVRLIHAAGTGAVLTLVSTTGQHDLLLADTLFDAVMGTVLTDVLPTSTDSTANAAVTLRAAVPGLAVLTAGERSLLGEWLDRVTAGP